MKNLGDLKDKLKLLGWIFGLLAVISVIWILSQSLHANYLLKTVNNVFAHNGDSRRVSEYIPGKYANKGLLGFWYSISYSQDLLFTFTVFQDGALIPLAAIVTPEGSVKEIIPLSAHAVQVFERIPESILKVYIKRIESKQE